MDARLALGLVCALAAPPAQEGLPLAELLARARAASGHAALRAHPLRATGTATRMGAEGELCLELLPDGAFRLAVGGPLPAVQASDGTVVWESDWTGMAGPIEMADRERVELAVAVLSGRWLDDEGGCVVTRAEADGVALDLRLADGLLAGRVALDPATHRARRLELGTVTWHLEDWREPLGFPFPHRVRLVERSGAEHVYRVASLERADGLRASALGMPAAPPADHRLDPAASPSVASRRVKTGHLLVHPRVDGRDVGWFILDTGAGAMCITPGLADELGLATLGTVTANGVGGSVAAPIRRGGELAVGPLVMAAPTWVELDLAFLEAFFGVPVAGILGHDLFARAVVSIDGSTPHVELHAPEGYTLPSDGEAGAGWQRLHLDDRLPCVEARFEGGRSGVFRIDTGANGTLSFQASAVARWGLLEGRDTRTSLTGGVGGFVQVPAGELAWFELGGRRIAPVEGVAFERQAGPLALPPHVAGTIGGALLEPLTVVFDVPHRRIAFVPRAE